MANIDESKFGRLTADLLVRKGDAEPSAIRRARPRKIGMAPSSAAITEPAEPAREDRVVQSARLVQGDGELLVPYDGFEQTESLGGAKKKQYRIMIQLSEEEHETLGILAVKRGWTRHQALRKALDAYLDWLVDEYSSRCRCIASTCSTGCDHLSAAEVSERPTDVE